MSCTSSGPDTGVPTTPEPWNADLLRVQALAAADGTCTLQVVGEIDLATSPVLRSHGMEQLMRAPRGLVLDLRRVDFLGSSGLAVLIELRSAAQQRDIGLRLVTTSRAVLRPLMVTGLIELFDVDES